MTSAIQPLVNFIGVVLQFAAAALLAMMFLLLRPYARRRWYFRTWSVGWLALVVAYGALLARSLLDDDLLLLAAEEQRLTARAAYGIYLFGTSLFSVLLAAGANRYASATPQRGWLRVAVPLLLAYTVVAISRSPDFHSVLTWQAPLVVAGFGWSAARLGSLPASRHGIGLELTTTVLSFKSLLWVLYSFAFTYLPDPGVGEVASVLEALVRYHSFVDVVLHVVLGFGMMLLLMEQAKREVDDAHAELAVAHSVLRRAAYYDSLTGCLNRRAFDDGVAMENARRGYGAVMMFDLDDLKDVNDAHGHSAGDLLLRHLTDALRRELRPSDKLYRWGGDEFMMLLPGADEQGARSRLRSVLNDAAVLRLGTQEEPVRLNVSMGSAAYASAEEIMKAVDAADAMMYREKAGKKGSAGP